MTLRSSPECGGLPPLFFREFAHALLVHMLLDGTAPKPA
jgi:hypothetical protein